MCTAAFSRRYTSNHLRAIGDGLFGVKGALGASYALADHFGVFIDEDRHGLILLQGGLRAVVEGFFWQLANEGIDGRNRTVRLSVI